MSARSASPPCGFRPSLPRPLRPSLAAPVRLVPACTGRNINWRSTDSLKIDQVQLSLYLEPESYDRSGGGTSRTVWYDDVVVATKYIGLKVQHAATRD